jgi:tripartite-type tricarboxylate transporter receptor subunit TctC
MAPALIVANPNVSYRNAADLIADMRASKEPFQVGTPGVSTVNHLSALLFAQTGRGQSAIHPVQRLLDRSTPI